MNHRGSKARTPAVIWLIVGLLAAAGGWSVGARTTRRLEPSVSRVSTPAPRVDDRDRYVGSQACRACHPGAHDSWHRTFHRTMTQRPDPASVLGAFDGRTLGPDGRHRVGRDGDSFWVQVPGPEDRPLRRDVVLVTGAHHMQVYWTRPSADDGRLEAFAWAWLNEEQRWVPNEATLLRPPAEPLTYTWNRVCIKCHVVSPVPGYDAVRDEVDSSVAELGIACEACHGPAAEHVDRYRDPLRRYATHLGLGAEQPQAIVSPSELSAQESSEICGQCHAITLFVDDEGWVRSGHDQVPPAPISSWGTLVRHPLRASGTWSDTLLDDNPDFFAERFWSDGMVRVSGREYNGLVESPCFASGELGCLSCHQMHGSSPDDQLASFGTKQQRDRMCTQCHEDIEALGSGHTHHRADSEGSRCDNCHMPHTTYGLLKAIRSHEIDSPNLDASLRSGRPNACNLCHLDQTEAWAGRWLHAWYDQPLPAEPLDDQTAASVRWLLSGEAGVRALAAWHLGWDVAVQTSRADWAPPLLAELLGDAYLAVRLVAARALARHDGSSAIVDPLSSNPEAIRAEVIERWRNEADRESPPASVPISKDEIDRSRVDALLQARDDRPVALAE